MLFVNKGKKEKNQKIVFAHEKNRVFSPCFLFSCTSASISSVRKTKYNSSPYTLKKNKNNNKFHFINLQFKFMNVTYNFFCSKFANSKKRN